MNLYEKICEIGKRSNLDYYGTDAKAINQHKWHSLTIEK